MAGLGAIGAMNQIPNMPTNNISQIASSGMIIANVGQLSKNAMGITKSMNIEKKKFKWK
jgi:hypothetical protein